MTQRAPRRRITAEETAVPVIDPVDVRLGQLQTLPDPWP